HRARRDRAQLRARARRRDRTAASSRRRCYPGGGVTCLDDDTVLGLIEGRLAATALADVDAHLDVCASCRDVVSQLARTHGDGDVLARGHAVGRYVIGDLLGSGAMGRVYSAWQPELDRRVAIKLLRDDSGDARDRLLREAQAMARLNHPNVVTVHEV